MGMWVKYRMEVAAESKCVMCSSAGVVEFKDFWVSHLFGPGYRWHWIAGRFALESNGATFAGGKLAGLRNRPDGWGNCR